MDTIIAHNLQVAIAFVLLYVQLGVSALVGGALIVIMFPVQYCIGQKLADNQKQVLVSIGSVKSVYFFCSVH